MSVIKLQKRMKGVLTLKAALATGIVMGLISSCYATENWEVEGNHGAIVVEGALSESACRLEMDTQHQTVMMGDIGTGRLKQVGDRGNEVGFDIRLVDCIRSAGASRDEQSGNLLWAKYEPVVTVSFRAVLDDDNPQLIKANGVGGVGLRLLDPRGRDVRLGGRGEPMILTGNRQAVLHYTLIPERTSAPLQAGAYRALVDFRLSYD